MIRILRDHWGPRVCALIPLDVWHTVCRVRLIVPHYHLVSDADRPHVSALYRFKSVAQFNADLDFLLRYYSPVTEQDVIRHLHDERALPPRSVLLTFDDGFCEIHDVIAPLLRAKGAPATFFLITSTIDNRHMCHPQKASLLISALARRQSRAALEESSRLLSLAGVSLESDLASRIRAVSYRQRHVLDDLGRVLECDFEAYLATHKPYVCTEQVEALMRQGFAVGAHSVDHPPFAELSLAEQLSQTRESMRWLSERFRFKCQSFAFPYRDNGASLDFFQAMFAEGELKVSFGTNGLVPHDFRYNLPRFSTERTDSSAAEVLATQFARRLRSVTLGPARRMPSLGA